MKSKKEFLILLLVVIDIIILILMVLFGVGLIHDIVGSDVIEYENWFGDLDDPIRYRFGAGCWEYTVFIAKLIIFIVIQIKQAVKNSFRKPLLIAGIFMHLIIFAAGFLYVYNFGDGYSVNMLLEHLFGS